MPKLKDRAQLIDYQNYAKEIAAERGWDKNNPLESFLLFSEEIGELAKAIRNSINLYHEKGKTIKENELENEFADVFSYLLELANQFNIDLEKAFRNKDAENKKRVWK